jgi:hypothetical protein
MLPEADDDDALSRHIERARRWLAALVGLALFGLVMAMLFG